MKFINDPFYWHDLMNSIFYKYSFLILTNSFLFSLLTRLRQFYASSVRALCIQIYWDIYNTLFYSHIFISSICHLTCSSPFVWTQKSRFLSRTHAQTPLHISHMPNIHFSPLLTHTTHPTHFHHTSHAACFTHQQN